MTRTKSTTLAMLAVLLLPMAANADTIVIDFEGLEHGRIVNSQIAGITVSAENIGGGPNLAVAFNSNETGTRDPDLEDPWELGNLAGNTDLGNLLILQENSTGSGDGIVDLPDDEGSRPAGSITIDFVNAFSSIGFDLIDIEGTDPSDEPGSVEIYLGAVLLQTLDFIDFLGDPTVEFGNNSANRIDPISGFGAADRIVFILGGSGAIDNIVAVSVPEPGTLALLGLGLLGMGAARRRRKV